MEGARERKKESMCACVYRCCVGACVCELPGDYDCGVKINVMVLPGED